MASVRASLVTQARMAARHLDGAADTTTHPAVGQLVRCAQLSPDATHALRWARHSLEVHGVGRADRTACRLLDAAIDRLDRRADGGSAGVGAAPGSLAWR